MVPDALGIPTDPNSGNDIYSDRVPIEDPVITSDLPWLWTTQVTMRCRE